MSAKMMVAAVVFSFATISGAWAQSSYTTGTAASSARHGYPSPYRLRHGYIHRRLY
jgi:hypothetical protein